MTFIKDIIEYIKQRRILKHIVLWFFLFLFTIFSQSTEDSFFILASTKTAHIVPQIILSYFLAYWLIPKYLFKKRYILFALFALLSAYVICALSRIYIIYLIEPIVRAPPFTQEPIIEILMDWKKLMRGYFFNVYSMAFLFLLIKLSVERIEEQSIKKEKTVIELKMLKAQLNPHFLFNTLNNIYSLSVMNSPKTSDSIGKLSEILDYVLYRCDHKYVPLSGEVTLLENYILLEKLRYDDRLEVTFKHTVEPQAKIAPLILLSIVENAFKHGAGEDSGSPKIKISLTQEEDSLSFSVFNTTIPEQHQTSKNAIGMKNIRKQLDLLYPNAHTITIHEDNNSFMVSITLNISQYEG